MRFQPRVLMVLLGLFSGQVMAQAVITAQGGVAVGGKVITNSQETLSLDSAPSWSIAVELPVLNGHAGFFYNQHTQDVDDINQSLNAKYFLFQSRADYELSNDWQSYLGIGLGISHYDASWVDQNTQFATSIFTGVDYKMNDHFAVTGALRWLGTAVDNDTSGQCVLPSANPCQIKFETDWLNQAYISTGIRVSF